MTTSRREHGKEGFSTLSSANYYDDRRWFLLRLSVVCLHGFLQNVLRINHHALCNQRQQMQVGLSFANMQTEWLYCRREVWWRFRQRRWLRRLLHQGHLWCIRKRRDQELIILGDR
jgi:hypothetical protein